MIFYKFTNLFFHLMLVARRQVICKLTIYILGSGAALSVRKRTFHAPMVRCMWQSHVVWLFYFVARGRVFQLIVNIFIAIISFGSWFFLVRTALLPHNNRTITALFVTHTHHSYIPYLSYISSKQ